MSKTSNTPTTFEEDELQPEYDFSNGIRGKYRDRNLAPQLPGIQFLKNARGQKTAVLLNLQIHNDLWTQVTQNRPDLTDFQYLTQSESRSVYLDLKNHLDLWQTLYDQIITIDQTTAGLASANTEGTVSQEQAEQQLGK
jgi:hypothetical protein